MRVKYFIKVEQDIEQEDFINLCIYEDTFPARHEFDVQLTSNDAEELVEDLQKAIKKAKKDEE